MSTDEDALAELDQMVEQMDISFTGPSHATDQVPTWSDEQMTEAVAAARGLGEYTRLPTRYIETPSELIVISAKRIIELLNEAADSGYTLDQAMRSIEDENAGEIASYASDEGTTRLMRAEVSAARKATWARRAERHAAQREATHQATLDRKAANRLRSESLPEWMARRERP